MIEDANIQKLIKEGVHEDIVLNRGRFESCNMCGLRYGKTLKPLLLNCGHFICQQCLIEQNRCGYPACKNTSPTIKNKKINTANADSNANQNSTFQFGIRFLHANQIIMKEVKGSSTFRDLLHEVAQKYVDKFGQNSTLIAIGSKSADYALIKNERIIDKQEDYGFCSTNSQKGMNNLLINERFFGGNHCDL